MIRSGPEPQGPAGVAPPFTGGHDIWRKPGMAVHVLDGPVRHHAGTPILISNFSATPGTVIVSQSTNISVIASGGVPPLTFVYQNLPFGCASLNGSRFSCIPAQSSRFTLVVQITDVVGDVATANTSLVVLSGHGSPPLVASFTANPASVAVHRLTYITVTAKSQSSTPDSVLAFTFFDLPPGCASFNQTNLTCLPSAPGTYRILVQVSDGFGAVSFASTNLTVLPGPGGGASSDAAGSYVYLYVGMGAMGVVGVVAYLVRTKRPGTPPAQSSQGDRASPPPGTP